LTSTGTALRKVPVTGDQRTACATSSSSVLRSASPSTWALMRTAVKPTGFSLMSPTPHTEVMLMSPSSSSSMRLNVMPRSMALAWMPTEMHEPSAASAASDGLGAVSSPSSAGGSSTMCAGRLRM